VRAGAFVDDNDAAGYAQKPVFNVEVVGASVEAMAAFAAQLRAARTDRAAAREIWPAALGLGNVHVEGGALLPRLCLVRT
jgi:hypothetical protein